MSLEPSSSPTRFHRRTVSGSTGQCWPAVPCPDRLRDDYICAEPQECPCPRSAGLLPKSASHKTLMRTSSDSARAEMEWGGEIGRLEGISFGRPADWPGPVVDERTVSRYLPRGSTSPDRLQCWLVFLRNPRDSLVGTDPNPRRTGFCRATTVLRACTINEGTPIDSGWSR